jgi:hypothetical protein
MMTAGEELYGVENSSHIIRQTWSTVCLLGPCIQMYLSAIEALSALGLVEVETNVTGEALM